MSVFTTTKKQVNIPDKVNGGFQHLSWFTNVWSSYVIILEVDVIDKSGTVHAQWTEDSLLNLRMMDDTEPWLIKQTLEYAYPRKLVFDWLRVSFIMQTCCPTGEITTVGVHSSVRLFPFALYKTLWCSEIIDVKPDHRPTEIIRSLRSGVTVALSVIYTKVKQSHRHCFLSIKTTCQTWCWLQKAAVHGSCAGIAPSEVTQT